MRPDRSDASGRATSGRPVESCDALRARGDPSTVGPGRRGPRRCTVTGGLSKLQGRQAAEMFMPLPDGRTYRVAPRVLLACGIAILASAAHAEPAHIFRLPAEPVDRALVRFGVQAGVSIGGFPVPGCAGTSRAVVGVLTASAALRRLLPPGCTFERVDSRAYRIAARTVAPQASPPPVAPTAAEVGELVVTAEKRQEPLRGSPFAVSAMRGGDIERLGGKSFADVALQFPGVAETNLGPGRNKIFIRGISDGAFTGRTQATVGLYLGDVPITYNAPDPDLRLTDIERVEVLRGPQGTLYGSGSIGGIVRLVPAKPDPSRYTAAAAVEGVNSGHKDRAVSAEAMLNVPLLDDRAAIRGVVYRDDLSGYLDNPALGLEDVNRGHRSGARIVGLVNLPGGWEALASYARQSILTKDSQYIQGGGRLARDTGIREPHDNDFTVIGGALSRMGSTARLRVSAAYIDHDLSTRYDATGAFDLAPAQTAAFDETQRVELWVTEAVVASASPGRFRWLGGVFGSYASDTSGAVLDAAPWGGPRRSAYARADRLTETAAFGELTYDITPALTATAGGRVFASRVKTRAGSFGLAQALAPEVRGTLTDKGFAPKLRLSYAFAPDVVVYVQGQDGYRTGGFNIPAGADGRAGDSSGASFRPDRLRNYEVGGEAAWFDRSLTLRAALFKATWRNVQTDQFRPSGLPVTLNIGDGSNTGLEVEAVWRPDAHWRLRLNGLVNEPQLTRTSDSFPARVDIGLPGVAKHAGALDVTYGWDLPLGLKAELSAQATYVGRSFLTFDGASAAAMGGYGQGRISATVRNADWQLRAYVANVTDESGNTFAFGNPFSRARSQQQTPLPPRTFGLALRRSF